MSKNKDINPWHNTRPLSYIDFISEYRNKNNMEGEINSLLHKRLFENIMINGTFAPEEQTFHFP